MPGLESSSRKTVIPQAARWARAPQPRRSQTNARQPAGASDMAKPSPPLPPSPPAFYSKEGEGLGVVCSLLRRTSTCWAGRRPGEKARRASRAWQPGRRCLGSFRSIPLPVVSSYGRAHKASCRLFLRIRVVWKSPGHNNNLALTCGEMIEKEGGNYTRLSIHKIMNT